MKITLFIAFALVAISWQSVLAEDTVGRERNMKEIKIKISYK